VLDPSKLTSGRSYGAILIPTGYPHGWCGTERANSGPMTVGPCPRRMAGSYFSIPYCDHYRPSGVANAAGQAIG
jgi:hypothetical protein